MSYARNAWYVAGFEMDLETGKPYPMMILGEPIVIYRAESGRLAALEDRCVHRLAPLSLGRCEGERLRCMYHGLLCAPIRSSRSTAISGCGWAIRRRRTRR
jgi:phenylpropionate dioxygenase-like ring-hydroxylating dioxygenase large terminal subunit